jgi:hypothetical protein
MEKKSEGFNHGLTLVNGPMEEGEDAVNMGRLEGL